MKKPTTPKSSDPISSGKVAAIVLAAGSGSRLRFEKPKGCFPITKIKKKSLFQLLCEKLKAASLFYGQNLEMAFMISEESSEKTKQFFLDNNLFSSSIHFFESQSWPLLDLEGRPNGLFGPCGNGSLFKSFLKSSIFQRWLKKGVEHVAVISIDNPLANPFDADFATFHFNGEFEASLVGIQKKEPLEKLGTIVEVLNRIEVSEYGTPLRGKELASNAGIYFFSLSFMEKAASMNLPIYRIKKSCNGSLELNCYKLEQYIFDVLPSSDRTGVFLKTREEVYAPLKNFVGDDSILSVQTALQKFEMKRLSDLGLSSPKGDFELSCDFYYPTKELIMRWKGKEIGDLIYIGDR